MSHLTVIAYASAKAGKENELKKILQGLVAPTRAEAGCLNYDLHQSLSNPLEFVFHENWTSKQALDAHLQTRHIKEAGAAAKDLLAEPIRVTLWNQI